MEKNVSLRQLQLIQVDMAKVFFDFCDHHSLNYSLIGGSLLGAIRHSGFIPWDDDVDIGMPRPDYDRMLKIAESEGIAKGLRIVSGDYNNDFALPFAKLLDERTIVLSESKEYEFDGNALWIDIMPFDGLGNDINIARKIMNKESKLYKAIGRATSIPWKRRDGEKGLIGFVRCAFRQVYRIIGFNHFKDKIIKLAKENDYNNSKYIAIVVWGLYGEGEIIRKTDFEKYTTKVFEEIQCQTMGCWDYYLKGIYGDYMQLPPENKRKSPHSIRILMKQQ